MTDVLKNIKLDDITHNPNIGLRTVDRESLAYEELVESIKVKGILNPISVIPAAEGESSYVVMDGLHRFTAAKDAGLTEIPALIKDFTESEILEAQIVANVQRIESKPAEYSKQLVRILHLNPTMTIAELSNKLGKSYQWLKQRLQLVALTEKIQKLVDDQKICLTNAYSLSKLPLDEQENFLEHAMSLDPAEFVPSVGSRLTEIRKAKLQGRKVKDVEFVPSARLRKASDLKTELEEMKQLAEIIKDVADPFEAAKKTLEWVLSLDSASVEMARQKWEAVQAEKEAAKKRRKEEAMREAAELAAEATA